MMPRYLAISFIVLSMLASIIPQSGRTKGYSESSATNKKPTTKTAAPQPMVSTDPGELEVIRVETDLVVFPVRVTDKKGRPIADIKQEEVRIFEDGVEKELAYFSDTDQPFTVALLLDMSYSSVFKLLEIQEAAKKFGAQLRPVDKVMVISFAEKPVVLCEATNDRKVLKYAIEGSRIASGTGLYLTLDMVLEPKAFADLGPKGHRAVQRRRRYEQ